VSLAARQQALAALLRDVAEDARAYPALLQLLQQQFDAAVRHQNARLVELASAITQAVDAMRERCARRVTQVALLLGPQARMAQVFALLKGASRAKLESEWAELEKMVLECKRLNQRNSTLLTDQFSIMQRVLHGEENIYAPL
jgi:flagellar biosynthesis protein FlgN